MLEIKITGNVGRIKLVTAQGKTPVLNLSVATNRKVGEREFTDWSSVKIWGERAIKITPHIQAGTKLLITGRPEARAFKANDGTAKAELVVHATDVEFLSSKKQAGSNKDDYGFLEEEAERSLEKVLA